MIKIFEQIFREASKARFINKIEGLSDEDKQKYIAFFDKYPNIQFDWNNKSLLNKEYLDKFIHDYEEKRLQKDKSLDRYRLGTEEDGARKMFKSHYPDLEIVYENDDWFFVWVKTYEGARFCDSADCGSQKARWCIGYEQDTYYWDIYTESNVDYDGYLDSLKEDAEYDADEEEDYLYDLDEYHSEKNFIYKHNNVFVMAYRKGKAKNDDLKFMLQINMIDNEGEAWRQTDHQEETIDKSEWEEFFNLPSSLLLYKNISNHNIEVTYNTTNGILYSVTGNNFNGVSIFNGKIKYKTSIDKVNINDDLVIGNQWKTIKADAFKNCIFNGKIIITKDSSTNIESGAFNEAEINSTIIFDKDLKNNAFFGAIIKGNISFSKNIDSLSKNIFLNTKENYNKDIIIPNTIKNIGKGTFRSLTCKSITLPEGITEIPEDLFYYAHIGTIILPNSINTINENAFCYAIIDNIILPQKLISIEYNAFKGAYIKSSLKIPDSVTKLDDYSFYECHVDGEFILPKNLTYIGENAISSSSTTNIKKLAIPDSVKFIGNYALSGNIIVSDIPKSLSSLSEGAFDGCTFYGNVTIPNSIDVIKKHAFSSTKIKGSFILPDNLTAIDEDAFISAEIDYSYLSREEYNKRTIIIPNSVTFIGNRAFMNSNFRINNLPNSLKKIGVSAFIGCTFTSDIVLPDSLNMADFSPFYRSWVNGNVYISKNYDKNYFTKTHITGKLLLKEKNI